MSCDCNQNYSNCDQGCDDCNPCSERCKCTSNKTSDQVFYKGPNLECLDIANCDSLSEVIQKVDVALCELLGFYRTTTTTTTGEPTTTTTSTQGPSTTTTTAPPTTTTTTTILNLCIDYLLEATSALATWAALDCGGNVVGGILATDGLIEYTGCIQSSTFTSNNLNVIYSVICTTTTTTTITPSTTSTTTLASTSTTTTTSTTTQASTTTTSTTTEAVVTTTTTTEAPTYSEFLIFFDVTADPSPGGWNSQVNACAGTGTPLNLYSQPTSLTFADLITNGHALYNNTSLTLPFDGQGLWYKSQSAPDGESLRIDINGFIDTAIYTCP